MTTTTEPAWLEQLREQHSGGPFAFAQDEAAKTVEIKMQLRSMGGPAQLVLTTVPEGWTALLTRATTGQTVGLTVNALRLDTRLVISVKQGQTSFQVNIGDDAGDMEIETEAESEAPERPAVILIAKTIHNLAVRGCHLELTDENVANLRMHDSRLAPHTVTGQPDRCVVSTITVSGSSTVDATVQVQNLVVRPGVRLEVPHSPLGVASLAPDKGGARDVELLSPPPPGPNQGQPTGVLQAGKIEPGLSVRLVGPTRLELLEEASNLEVRGPGELMVNSNARVQGLTLTEEPQLSVGTHAVLTEVQGEAYLVRRAAHAHIAGRPDHGLKLLDIRGDDDSLRGTTLENIEIPDTPIGRQNLSRIDVAGHFTPYIRNLPSGRFESVEIWRTRRRGHPWETCRMLLRRQRPKTQADLARLRGDDEYVKTLARLAASHGAPGSVRTKLAWAAYRMRNLTARTWQERGALSAYRLIGYGERPGPALLTWVAVALLVIPFRYGLSPDPTVEGIERFGGYLRETLFSPLHLLRLGGGDTDDGNEWHLLGKILIAGPFVTAILAMRKYLKGERELL